MKEYVIRTPHGFFVRNRVIRAENDASAEKVLARMKAFGVVGNNSTLATYNGDWFLPVKPAHIGVDLSKPEYRPAPDAPTIVVGAIRPQLLADIGESQTP